MCICGKQHSIISYWFIPWYSWNTSKLGIKHQSINLSVILHVGIRRFKSLDPNFKKIFFLLLQENNTIFHKKWFIWYLCLAHVIPVIYKELISNLHLAHVIPVTHKCLFHLQSCFWVPKYHHFELLYWGKSTVDWLIAQILVSHLYHNKNKNILGIINHTDQCFKIKQITFY